MTRKWLDHFCHARHDGHAVVLNRQESVIGTKSYVGSVDRTQSDLAKGEDRENWFVTRKDSDLALGRAGDNLLRRARPHFVIGRNDADLEFSHG